MNQITEHELHMSDQYVAVLCALAGIGTVLVLLLLIFGQPFANLFVGGR
jgi:hypothetical protein